MICVVQDRTFNTQLMKLNIKAFAITGAITWGALVCLYTWWLIVLEGFPADPIFLSRLYPGYEISPLGSLVGLVWGLVDGLIVGAFFAWMYNRLVKDASK